MPWYEYVCADCGAFSESRPMTEFDLPACCPACGERSPRALTVPQFSGMDAARRVAAATNERSAHAPRASRSHPAGCSCCRPKPAGAAKGFAGTRPWMISH